MDLSYSSSHLLSLNTNLETLSPGQERLWLHQSGTAAGSPLYNLPIAYYFSGQLDIAILKKSLQEIIQRHAILRTEFVTLEETPKQKSFPSVKVSLPLEDLSHLDPEQQGDQLKKIAAQTARQPFNLSQHPLWRFQLLRLNDQQHILLLTIHHIICDHWSLHIWLEELATLYEAYAQGLSSPLRPLPRQYEAFAQWQHQWLQGKQAEAQLLYWQEHLGGEVSPLRLPSDRQEHGMASYQGARQPLTISKPLTESLKQLSEQQDATLFMTLLAAFKALLFQYTQQEDMIVCTPVAGRHRPQSKGLIGYFNNILPLRTNLIKDPSFRQLIDRVRQVALGAYKQMDLPFQKIANLPHLVRSPLTKAMFALQHSPKSTYTLNQLTITYPSFQNAHNGTANFDLSLFLEEKEGQLTGVLDYKTDLFEATTISQMLTAYQKVLEQFVNNPELHLSDLPRLRQHQNTSNAAPKKSNYIAPQKEIEREIAAIWQSLLKVERVGRQDNFFDLGGNSLALAQVQAQLKVIFERPISIIDLFNYPTISSLADYITQETPKTDSFASTAQINAQRQKLALQKQKQLVKLKTRKSNNV